MKNEVKKFGFVMKKPFYCQNYCVLLIGCACYCPLWTFMPMLYDM